MLQNLAGHHWGSGRCHWEKEDQSWKIYCSTWFQAVFLFLFLIRFPFSLGNYGSNHHGIAIFCIFREWGGRNIVPLIVQSSWQNALWQETSLSFFRPEQNVPIPLNTVPNTSWCQGSYFSAFSEQKFLIIRSLWAEWEKVRHRGISAESPARALWADQGLYTRN